MPLTRDEMTALFQIGVQAADPRAAVRNSLLARPLPPCKRVFLLAFGKAACAMAEAALPHIAKPAAALVVTNPENAVAVTGAEVIAAGHPVPDEHSLRAGQAAEALLAQAGADDRVLVLVSGGGSALLVAPVAGLSLTDKARVSEILLGAGLDIVAMNAVRQHLSRLKGGGLLRAAAPAPVTALILSDVIGDDLRAIASGPTVAPIAARVDVVADLQKRGLWQHLPDPARVALLHHESGGDLPAAENRLIGSNARSVAAMAEARPDALPMDMPLVGDVGAAAQTLAHLAQTRPGLHIMGGETTVTLRGTGLGGRNQELALRLALELEGRADWRFLSGGTDGRDGPTEAAGAVVDGATCARIRAAGGDPAALLANNDSHRALALAGDLLITGGTGTNVADLQILSCA